ncbi:MAG: DUF6701 domain-containing protein [Burkholderiaceae bacterium]
MTFDRSVTGVDTSDFNLSSSGLASTSISGVSGSGTTYTVTASTGTGSGTLGLNLVDDDTIRVNATSVLGGTGTGNGNFTGDSYTVDRNAPTVSSIVLNGSSPTNAATVSWTVTFSEAVTGVDASDFSLANTGLTGPALVSVTGSGNTYIVTASTGTGNGSLGLNLTDNDSIADAAGNVLRGTSGANGSYTGQVYTIDRGIPVLGSATSICGLNRIFVRFSEPLDTVSAQNPANYNISGFTVFSATLLADGMTVALQTSTMSPGTHTLTVSNVSDLALNPVTAASQASFVHTGGVLTPGMRGLYYGQNGVQRAYFTGTPVERIDSTINFNWGTGIPVAGIPGDDFSVRWTGFFRPPQTGSYQLQTRSDDGVRLYLNGQTLVENWTDHSATNNTSTSISLTQDQYYPLQMEFYERGGDAEARLLSSFAGGGFSAVPAAQFFYCSVPPTATPGAFNAFESNTANNQISGVIKTKVAGTGFVLDLVALNTAKDAVQPGFASTVKVELVANKSTPNTGTDSGTNCPTSLEVLSTLPTLTFNASDNGRKNNVSFGAVPNAWQDVRVRISYPATGTVTVVSCSNDNFAIRPAKLDAIQASNANWNDPGYVRSLDNTAVNNGAVHKAGRPFSIRATAYNSVNGVTSNYGGNPTATITSCLAALGNASSCTSILGTLNPGAWSAPNPVTGTVATSNARYSEVGSFYLQLGDETFAAVDDKSGDSTAAERHVPLSASFAVGRFVPDHFIVETVNTTTPEFKTFNDTTCSPRSFTYIGQKFGYKTPPVALITARNAVGQDTKNYQGRVGQPGNHLWKLGPGDVAQAYASAPGTGTLHMPEIGAATIAPKNDDSGTGLITVNANDRLSFKRETAAPLAPQTPFNANISLTISVADGSELSGTSPAASINTNTAAVFGSGGGIGFDAGNEFRYGILRMSNAHGSELLQLPVLLETQYWNGTAFVTNAADHCSRFEGASVSLSNYQKNLNACETKVPNSGRLAGGRGSFVLTAPGNGNNGSVDLRINLAAASSASPGDACPVSVVPPFPSATNAEQAYLQIKSGATFTADPTARATFGVKKSGPVIYLREMY